MLGTDTVKTEQFNESLFDNYGRCIPSSLEAAAHKQSRRYFSVVQPIINYDEIYERFNQAFNICENISCDEFKYRAEAILDSLRIDEEYQNITHGVAVPFILPKAEYDDIGEALQNIYLPAVDKSFHLKFPNYSFVNHCKDSLSGKFRVANGSRHDRLLKAMSSDIVVGYYFPCLLEYSVPAAIEQMKSLDDRFLLAGGFDTSAAFIGTPDLLLRTDGYPPLLWLSGLVSDTDVAGYHFEAYGYGLTFNRRAHLKHVAEYWASGLIVIG